MKTEKDFIALLDETRHERGLTYRQLANEIGMKDHTELYKVLRNQRKKINHNIVLKLLIYFQDEYLVNEYKNMVLSECTLDETDYENAAVVAYNQLFTSPLFRKEKVNE